MSKNLQKHINPDLFEKVEDTVKGHVEYKDGKYYNALGFESSETHTRVALDWQKQCLKFPDYADKIIQDTSHKRDIMCKITDIKIEDDLSIRFPDNTQATFSNHGLAALVAKFTNIPKAMMDWHVDNNEHTLLARHIKKSLEDYNTAYFEKKRDRFHNQPELLESKKDYQAIFRLRTCGDSINNSSSGTPIIRWVGSNRYGIIDNHEVIDMLTDAFRLHGDIGDALSSHIKDDYDSIKGNMLLPDSMQSYPDSDYGVGIAFANSEVGEDVFLIRPFLFRAICINGCIWSRTDARFLVNKKHIGGVDKSYLNDRVKVVTNLALSEGHNLLEQMNYSRDAVIPKYKIDNVIAYLAKTNNLTIEEGKAWSNAYQVEHFESGFGIINGLTRAANRYEGNQRWKLESVAGQILTPALNASKDSVINNWDKIVNRAMDMDEKLVAKYIEE